MPASDLLVDAPVGQGQKLVVWEGMSLVAMISMPERILNMCCPFGPNSRCLCGPGKKVLGETKVLAEIGVVEGGEDDEGKKYVTEGDSRAVTKPKTCEDTSWAENECHVQGLPVHA